LPTAEATPGTQSPVTPHVRNDEKDEALDGLWDSDAI
jgi:hypothetical protein